MLLRRFSKAIPVLKTAWLLALLAVNAWILYALNSVSSGGILQLLFYSFVPGYSVTLHLFERAAPPEKVLASLLLSFSLLIGVASVPRQYFASPPAPLTLVAIVSLGLLAFGSRRPLSRLTKGLASQTLKKLLH